MGLKGLLFRQGGAAVSLWVILIATATAAPILEDVIEQNYVVEPNAVISIRNTDGGIRIYGSDGNEVKLQAIKRAYTQSRLDQIRIDIAATPSRLTIDTHYPPTAKWGISDRSGTVDYIIVVPWTCEIQELALKNGEVLIEGMRGKGVRASLANGRFFARNNFCNFSCDVGTGGLDLAYDWWEKDPRFAVAATIADGTLRAFVPSDALFHLNASSRDGQVFSDFIEQCARKKGGAPGVDVAVGTDPQMDLRLEALDGNVRVVEIYR